MRGVFESRILMKRLLSGGLVAQRAEQRAICLRLLVRWMPSCHLRRILWRPEFNRDVLLGLNRPFVQQSGCVTPLANGSLCARKKRERAAQEPYLQHLAELPDSGADPY